MGGCRQGPVNIVDTWYWCYTSPKTLYIGDASASLQKSVLFSKGLHFRQKFCLSYAVWKTFSKSSSVAYSCLHNWLTSPEHQANIINQLPVVTRCKNTFNSKIQVLVPNTTKTKTYNQENYSQIVVTLASNKYWNFNPEFLLACIR